MHYVLRLFLGPYFPLKSQYLISSCGARETSLPYNDGSLLATPEEQWEAPEVPGVSPPEENSQMGQSHLGKPQDCRPWNVFSFHCASTGVLQLSFSGI